MPIQNIVTDFVGEIDVNPRIVRIQCNDSYATITTAGYLNQAEVMGYTILPTDVIFITYLNNTFGEFTPVFSGNIITLQASNSGGVVLPVVAGNFPKFIGTTGQLTDSGIAPTNSAKPYVASVNAATTIGDIATFSDIKGTVQTSGVSPTDSTKPHVASVNGATTIGQVATFSDLKGTIQNGGALLSALQLSANIKAFNYSYAGGSSTATIPLSGVTTSSISVANLATATNPAVVNFVKILAPDQLTIVFDTDPGASTINIVAFLAPQ